MLIGKKKRAIKPTPVRKIVNCPGLPEKKPKKRRNKMVSVGIDVSKGKSMMAAVSQAKEVLMSPQEFEHSKEGFKRMELAIKALEPYGEIRVVMEATGHYHEPVAAALDAADFYVSVVNPVLVFDYGNNSVRKVKTDRKDALKIARYATDNRDELREYAPQEVLRQQLKTFSRQYNLCMKAIRMLENNLTSILDKTLPGANRLFSSRKRKDGRQKWIDFAETFWHTALITSADEEAFIQKYENWCAARKYQFKVSKAKEIYKTCRGLLATVPPCENTRLLISAATAQITATGLALATIKKETIRLASLLPEYEAVINMYGAGEILAAQLIAEIGDIRRFRSRGALIAFAGVDPLPQQSGKYEKKSTATSKRGSPSLRKTLFQVVCTYLRHSPENEPVFQFLDRKRAEGKPYFVYMTASANKFLRIYYARIKQHMQAVAT
jgi:transposase